jgi:hypothetical protein
MSSPLNTVPAAAAAGDSARQQTPTTSSHMASFDPLSPSAPSLQSLQHDTDLVLSSSPPISFKRRAAANQSSTTTRDSTTTGLLGNILTSRSNNADSDPSQQDIVPDLEQLQPHNSASSTKVTAPPRHITMPESRYRHISSTARSVAIDSDEEEDDETHDDSGDEQSSFKRRGHRGVMPGSSYTGSVNTSPAAWTRSISRTGPSSRHGRSFGAHSGIGRQAPLRNPLLMSPTDEQRLTQPSGANAGPSGSGGEALANQTTVPQSTPLPTIPIVVLCIAMMGEFLSASVASPFLYFMVESFGVGQGPEGGGEAAVGAWSGVVS